FALGDGETEDHYGMATIPYYFYWWGVGYPEFEEMAVNMGACVDIDEDGDIDKENGEDLDNFMQNANVVQTEDNIVDENYNPEESIAPCSTRACFWLSHRFKLACLSFSAKKFTTTE
ncbi:unnamed protein product, partial [marine sediment metagenome]